jgi:hypothetical protein
MNDTHADGWEVVRVFFEPTGETVIHRTGCSVAEEIPTWCVEWMKAEHPAAVTEMALCEVASVSLRPGQLYKFVIMPGCKRCEELAASYAWANTVTIR